MRLSCLTSKFVCTVLWHGLRPTVAHDLVSCGICQPQEPEARPIAWGVSFGECVSGTPSSFCWQLHSAGRHQSGLLSLTFGTPRSMSHTQRFVALAAALSKGKSLLFSTRYHEQAARWQSEGRARRRWRREQVLTASGIMDGVVENGIPTTRPLCDLNMARR